MVGSHQSQARETGEKLASLEMKVVGLEEELNKMQAKEKELQELVKAAEETALKHDGNVGEPTSKASELESLHQAQTGEMEERCLSLEAKIRELEQETRNFQVHMVG